MVGISYPGISQLYVARTQPPHLAAITPLSVIDDTYRGTLYPGGILNTGFAVPWAKERTEQAAPYGQGWEKPLVDAGDTICAANQLVRLQNPDPLAADHRQPASTRRRSATRSRRPSSPTTSTCRCSSPARGRTSRPAVTGRPSSTT